VPEAPGSAGAPPGRRFHARVVEARSFAELAREIEGTESDPEGVGIMTRNGRVFPVALDGVSLKASPLLKQELLAAGADAAHARGIADHSAADSRVLLLATWSQYQRVLPKLRRQPFRLRQLADEVEAALRNYTSRAPRTVPGAHRALVIGERTLVMGVLNVTPDSFSDGGRFSDPPHAIARAREMVAEGAALIDIGGESTRPGATPIPWEEEWRRVGPVLTEFASTSTVPVSIDTRSPEVARRAIAAGADIVNDVSGLAAAGMREVVAESGAAAVVMHMRGTPATMASLTVYEDVRRQVFEELGRSVEDAEAAGVPSSRILVDPGLGFAKTPAQSMELLAHVGELRSLGYPVVVGASRKSMIGALTEVASAADRLEGSLAAAVVAALQGAHIVRAHDVAATVRALRIADAARPGGEPAAPFEPDP
jgi:dihydropteroate synthase